MFDDDTFYKPKRYFIEEDIAPYNYEIFNTSSSPLAEGDSSIANSGGDGDSITDNNLNDVDEPDAGGTFTISVNGTTSTGAGGVISETGTASIKCSGGTYRFHPTLQATTVSDNTGFSTAFPTNGNRKVIHVFVLATISRNSTTGIPTSNTAQIEIRTTSAPFRRQSTSISTFKEYIHIGTVVLIRSNGIRRFRITHSGYSGSNITQSPNAGNQGTGDTRDGPRLVHVYIDGVLYKGFIDFEGLEEV